MNSKIIKVSMVLIFMLFFTGLFNSVFAYEFDVDKFNKVYEFNADSGDYFIGNYNVDFDRLTYSNSSGHSSYIYNNFIADDINNYSKIYGINFNNNKLYCAVLPLFSKGGLPITYLCLTSKNGSLYCGTRGFSFIIYIYDFDNNSWSCNSWSTSLGSYFNYIIGFDNEVKIYDSTDLETANVLFDSADFIEQPSIKLNTVRTGVKTGYVEFTPKNWDSHMYYIKDDMDELVRLIAEEELSVIHPQVKHYDGPVDIEAGEYVMGILFDNDGEMIFSQISDGLEVNYDSVTDTSHHLYLDKEDEDTYYLSIHGYEDGDYVEVSKYPRTDDFYVNDMQVLDSDGFEYNGLQIGYIYETALGHRNRKIKLSKNGITYFNLYDKDGNFINTCVLNSSNYYSGEDFDFDVELSFGSSPRSNDVLHLAEDEIRWVKIKPIIDVPSISNYELYIRISDYGTLRYIDEEDRIIYATHDSSSNNFIGIDLSSNSNGLYCRIDDKIYDYFYLTTGTYDCNFTFELQLRSKSGQILQTKSFNVNTSIKSNLSGTISSSTDGSNDTYVRNPSELSGSSLNSNNFSFDGLNSATDLNSLKSNLSGMLDNSIGFFSLLSTFFLLLPTWVSSLLYFFLFGIIVITLFRFVRGA